MTTPSCPDDCGRCCDPVVLPFTQAEVARTFSGEILDDADRRHVLTNLVPLPRRAGLAATADYIHEHGTTSFAVTATGEPVIAFSWFYRCLLFDPETRRCTDYEHRPPMCREYPLYGEERLDERKAIPSGCVYLPEPTRRTG